MHHECHRRIQHSADEYVTSDQFIIWTSIEAHLSSLSILLQHHSGRRRWVSSIGTGSAVESRSCLGMIGSLLSIKVFSSTKIRRNSSNEYLITSELPSVFFVDETLALFFQWASSSLCYCSISSATKFFAHWFMNFMWICRWISLICLDLCVNVSVVIRCLIEDIALSRFDVFPSYVAVRCPLDCGGLYVRTFNCRLLSSTDVSDLQSPQCKTDLFVYPDRFVSLALLFVRDVRCEHRRETSCARMWYHE